MENSTPEIKESQKDESVLKKASSVQDKFNAPNFGSRFLTEDQDVFSQNAWDHVPPPTDNDEKVATALARQKNAPVPDDEKPKYNGNPARNWDLFYKHNENNFFKDRKWLHLEFPELVEATQLEAGPVTILEVGCGAGNAIFPLLSSNKNPSLSVLACDYSPRAVKLVQSHDLYSSPPTGSIRAAVWDLSSPFLPPGILPNTVDIVVMIFVLSALHPDEWSQAIANVYTALKPGGKILIRDYGRYDLAQLRFKEKRLLADNFYIRGDKTRVYFFSLDDLATIFTGAPVSETIETTSTTVEETQAETLGTATPTDHETPQSELLSPGSTSAGEPNGQPEESSQSNTTSESQTDPGRLPSPHPSTLQHPLFDIAQLGVDNRLIVNRKRQLKMHRVWMQGKFVKLGQNQVDTILIGS